MSKRLHFIDVLRGLAACMVLIQHLFEVRSTAFATFSSNYLQSGVFGVALFFIISGFIIPYALEKSPSLAVFWLRRFFRLYPLYIVSLTLVIISGIFHGEHYTSVKLLLNILLINEPASMRIIGLSWTLTFEVIFYLLLSSLFLVKLQHKSLWNCLLLLLLAVLLAVIKHSYAAVVVAYFILFFSGNLFHQFFRQEIRPQLFYPCLLLIMVGLAIINYYGLSSVADTALGSRGFLPRTTANLLALLIFLAAMQLRHFSLMRNRILFALGEISYSIYLMQVITLPLFNSWWQVLSATLVLALLSHFCIERPFIRLGYTLGRKLKLHA